MSTAAMSRQQSRVLAVVALSAFLTPLGLSLLNVALPTIGRDLSLDPATLGLIASAFVFAAAILLLPFGRLADIRGRGPIFIAGLALFTSASLGLALAASGPFLLVLRALQGVAAAMTMSTEIAILSSAFAVSGRGRALGIVVACVYAGASVGPALGGYLTQAFGWRTIFLPTVLLGVVTTFAASRFVPYDAPERPDDRFDMRGSLVYGVGLSTFMLGLSLPLGFQTIALTGAGLLLLALFVRIERNTPRPLLDVATLGRNRPFVVGNGGALFVQTATFSVSFVLSLYLHYVGGLQPQEVGLLLLIQPAMQAVVSLVTGRLSDTVPPRLITTGGMLLILIALAALSQVGDDARLPIIAVSLAALGGGIGCFSAPNIKLILSRVEKEAYGVASAGLATVRVIGQSLSMGLAGAVLASYTAAATRDAAPSDIVAQSARTAFTLAASICCLGLLTGLIKIGRQPGDSPDTTTEPRATRMRQEAQPVRPPAT